MSAVSSANAAVARRADSAPFGTTPQTAQAIVDAGTAANNSNNAVAGAIGVITTYVPTEILTLYVAVIAAVHENSSKSAATQWITLLIFLVLTPFVVLLVYADKIRSENKPLSLSPAHWPQWEMSASTIAFAAWAFALPESPFATLSWYSSAVAGVVVLGVSILIGLLAPLFQQPLKP